MTVIYEKRTYDVKVGEMQQVKHLYSTEGWPALSAGGFDNKLIGYFVSDTGDLHQLIHLWRFDNDADRRDFWARLFANESFIAFAKQIRPLIHAQNVQLMLAAPWGPHP
jgi:hypothetical protein